MIVSSILRAHTPECRQAAPLAGSGLAPAGGQEPMRPMATAYLICVVDDEQSVRESLHGLLESVGFLVEAFSSAEDYLNSKALLVTNCLILDISMPRMSGRELQRELAGRGRSIPIIFITAYGDEVLREQVMSEGAVDCLLKPFSEDALLTAVQRALSRAGR
jgi:FixJ family two-component response regulator